MPFSTRDTLLIRQRLAEAVMWSRFSQGVLMDPRVHTRSEALRPPGHLFMEMVQADGSTEVYQPTTLERLGMVEHVVEMRRRALELAGVIAPTKSLILAGGRVLRVDLSASLWEGLSAYHSRGLVDEYDVPGHDTWIHLMRAERGDALIGWIGPEFLADAEAAVWANSTGCLSWVDEDELR